MSNKSQEGCLSIGILWIGRMSIEDFRSEKKLHKSTFLVPCSIFKDNIVAALR